MKAAPVIILTALFCIIVGTLGTPSALASDKIPSREIKVNHLYSMLIPNHMQEDTTLNDDASLQYADAADELYVIVIDENKKEFTDAYAGSSDVDNSKSVIENYSILQRRSLLGALNSISDSTQLKYEKVNGLKTYTFTASGFLTGIEPEILYKVRFFEGEETVYMVMTWTLTSKHTENLPEMDWMLGSFREL